jgi:hypothetical protein
MSVANANPFDLLDDENEDPQQLANAKLAAKPAEKPAAKKAPEPKGEPRCTVTAQQAGHS